METRSKSHRGVSATTPSGDELPPTPAVSAQTDGVSAGSRKGQGRTPRAGRQHHITIDSPLLDVYRFVLYGQRNLIENP